MTLVYLFWEDLGRIASVLAGPKDVDLYVPNRCVFGHFPETALNLVNQFQPSDFFENKTIFFDESQKELARYEKIIAKYPLNAARSLDVSEEGLVQVINSVKIYLTAKSEAEKQVTDLFYSVLKLGHKNDLSRR